MEIPFITTISLIWLIYTFLFTESDKQILDLFNRLKLSISINDKGAIVQQQLEIKMYLGIPEVIAYGENLVDGHISKKCIDRFHRNISSINIFKKILGVNLFLLTAHSILLLFPNCLLSSCSLQVHIILSLILSALFYSNVHKLPEMKFLSITSDTK